MKQEYVDRVMKAIEKLMIGNGRTSLDAIHVVSGLPTEVTRSVCIRLHRIGMLNGRGIDGLVIPKEKEEKTDELFEY